MSFSSLGQKAKYVKSQVLALCQSNRRWNLPAATRSPVRTALPPPSLLERHPLPCLPRSHALASKRSLPWMAPILTRLSVYPLRHMNF